MIDILFHLNKNNKGKRISTQALVFVSVASLVLSGCNRSNSNATSNISSNETEIADLYSEKTSDETEETDKIRKWMDYVSDDVIEEIHKDKIKYTIHADYSTYETDLDIYLPVDIKKYVDHETMTYDMYQVFDDYGWQKGDGYYYYIIDDLMIKISFWFPEKSDICGLDYDFVYKDNPEEYYYEYISGFPTDNMELHNKYSPGCDCDYLIEGSDNFYVTYDESIIFTYIISWVSVRPYTNPLIFVTYFDYYSDPFTKHDCYYIYFE